MGNKSLSWKKLILIGDSNTQFGFGNGVDGNWVSSLASHLQRRCDVIDRGFAGYNTRYLKDLLPRVLSEYQVDSICGVIVLLGTNDSGNSESIHVPLDEYKTNLRKIIEIILNYGVKKENIILITPPKIDHQKWSDFLARMQPGQVAPHHDNLVKDYANACLGLSKEMGLKCVDLNGAMSKSADYSKYLYDGLHLSPEGGKLFFENLKPIIDDMFIKNDNLKTNFPIWTDLKNRADISNIPQFSVKK